MTVETEEPQESDFEVQPYSLADNASKLRGDQALEHLVDLINRTTADIPVMLSIRGETIFGHLTGFRRWFEDLATQVEAIPVTSGPGSDPIPDGEKITDALGDYLRKFPVSVDEEDEDDEDDEDFHPPSYIHLRNAQVLTPAGRVQAGLWRGRLSEVVGWTISGTVDIN